jgi:hypothetical protein
LEGLRTTVAQCRPVIWLEWNYPQDEEMKSRLLHCLPECYSAKMLVMNRPVLGIFNRPSGQLVDADFNQRCNLVLFPE